MPQATELLWQAGPQWPRHAPLLFPIVGRLKNDELRLGGKTYAMTQHGFARDQRFEWLEREPASCKLLLADSEATRARYPFTFRLEATFTVNGADLDVVLDVTNTGAETLPASIGAHPAFNWPLMPGVTKEAYTLTFSDAETAPIRRLKGGLMRPTPEPSPIGGKALMLSEKLFDDDAVILDRAFKQIRPLCRRSRSIDRDGLGRLLGTRRLVEARRGAVPVHRALARICQPGGFRRRIHREARTDAYRAGRPSISVLPHPGQLNAMPPLSATVWPVM